MPDRPNDISEEFMKANILIEQGDLKGAAQILEEMVKAGEKQACLHLGLGDIYRELKLNDEAIECYNLAVSQKSEEYVDKRIRTAANAGLAKIYLDAAWEDFDNLPIVEKIEELRELIPKSIQSKPFTSMLFLGGWGSCTVPGTGGPGYWVRTPNGKVCLQC